MEDIELTSTYELSVVITPDLSEFDIPKVMDKIKNSIIGKNGSILKEHTWGKKRLAYPIGKAEYGHYQSVVFTGLKEVLAEIDKDIRLMPEIIRHLIISLDKEGVTVDQLFTPEKEAALLATMAKEKSEPTTHTHQTRASRGRITPKIETSATTPEPETIAQVRDDGEAKETTEIAETAIEETVEDAAKRREELDKKLDELLKE